MIEKIELKITEGKKSSEVGWVSLPDITRFKPSLALNNGNPYL